MDKSIIIRKTIFDIAINHTKDHKYISNKFSGLINNTFDKLLERKFSGVIDNNLRINTLEVDLGALHINQLDQFNLLEDLFIGRCSSELDYVLKNQIIHKSRTPNELIYNYIHNGYLPWWARDKKKVNKFFEKNILHLEKGDKLFDLILFNFDYFRKTYNLFHKDIFSRYIRKILDKKYNFYKQLVSLKSAFNLKRDNNYSENKSTIEIIYESLINFKNPRVDKISIISRVLEQELKTLLIDSPTIVEIFKEHIKPKNIANYEHIILKHRSVLDVFLHEFSVTKDNVDVKSAEGYRLLENMPQILMNARSLFEFFQKCPTKSGLLFEFVRKTFETKFNIKIIKIFNQIDKKIEYVEESLLSFQEISHFTDLEFKLLKIYLRFSLINFLYKGKDVDIFNSRNFIVYFLSELSKESKLNKKNIIKYFRAPNHSLVSLDIIEIFELFINPNQYSSISKKSREDLFYKDLYYYYLKYESLPNWSRRDNIDDIKSINFIKIFISKIDVNYLSSIFNDDEILNNKLEYFIDNQSDMLFDIIRVIGNEKDVIEIKKMQSGKAALYKYFNEKLWQHETKSIVKLLQLNSQLKNKFPLVDNYTTYESILDVFNSRNKNIYLYNLLIDCIKIIRKSAHPNENQKIISVLNNIIISKSIINTKDIWLFIIYLYKINIRLFNQIIQSSYFLEFINDTDLKERPYSLVKIKINSRSEIGFKIDAKSLVDHVVNYLNDTKSKISFTPILKKKILYQLSNYKESVKLDILYLNFEHLKYYIEIGSVPRDQLNLNKTDYKSIFYDLKEHKYYLLKKYLHQWSKDENKISRVLDLFKSDDDYLMLINFIYSNLNDYYEMMVKYLRYSKIELGILDNMSEDIKMRTDILYSYWSCSQYIIDNPVCILTLLCQTVLKENNITLTHLNKYLEESSVDEKKYKSQGFHSFLILMINKEIKKAMMEDNLDSSLDASETKFEEDISSKLDVKKSTIEDNLDSSLDVSKIKLEEDIRSKLDIKKLTIEDDLNNRLDIGRILDIEEGILINNCGLILFWPYLRTLFKRMGLIDHHDFYNDDAINKALIATNYLVTGDSKSQFIEHDLLLNKILCGISLNFTITPSIILNEFEVEICNTAINSVIHRWGKLKSIDSLREWFLLREGLLTENDSTYFINVQKKPQDILLKHLPWGFSMITSKLMKKRINVNWQY